AMILEGKGLAKFVGPDPSPKVMSSPMELHQQIQLAARAHYALSGAGEELILRFSEEQLLGGKFLLPGETEWYDQWPWKLVWPAAVSIITAVITSIIVGAIKGPGTK